MGIGSAAIILFSGEVQGRNELWGQFLRDRHG
jgi:hypothetical protein